MRLLSASYCKTYILTYTYYVASVLVPQVRTKDDALITVKLMVFFELTAIETMLNQTTDPIGDFIK